MVELLVTDDRLRIGIVRGEPVREKRLCRIGIIAGREGVLVEADRWYYSFGDFERMIRIYAALGGTLCENIYCSIISAIQNGKLKLLWFKKDKPKPLLGLEIEPDLHIATIPTTRSG